MTKLRNIFITWTSRWIGKYLKLNFINKYNIYDISWKKECDLSNIENVKKFIFNLPDVKFDAIILNAWFWMFWKFEDFEYEEYEELINVNLLANIAIIKFLENKILKNTKIIFIWSIIWKKFMKWAAIYQASKFWLRWFAWWLKKEWKKVFIINPKIVDTDFHKKLNINHKRWKTSLNTILSIINDILLWNEKRFEIDL